MASVTGVVYQNPVISIHHDSINDFYSIIANDDIPVGTLVLLEHPIVGKETTMMAGLYIDTALCQELYPRTDKDPQYTVHEKINYNMFKFNNDLVLGSVVSKFNHSCTPNSHMTQVDDLDGNKIYGVWSHRKVPKDQELTIDYVNHGDTKYHDDSKRKHHFHCECTREYIQQNASRSKVHLNISSAFSIRDEAFIHASVNAYLDSTKGKGVVKAQRQARKLAKKIILVNDESEIPKTRKR
jgi:hypothetical protein